MIKQKKKFVNVTPLSNIAKDRFINIMESFHACKIEDENEEMFFLISLNNEYSFHIQKTGNEHWKIEK